MVAKKGQGRKKGRVANSRNSRPQYQPVHLRIKTCWYYACVYVYIIYIVVNIYIYIYACVLRINIYIHTCVYIYICTHDIGTMLEVSNFIDSGMGRGFVSGCMQRGRVLFHSSGFLVLKLAAIGRYLICQMISILAHTHVMTPEQVLLFLV